MSEREFMGWFFVVALVFVVAVSFFFVNDDGEFCPQPKRVTVVEK